MKVPEILREVVKRAKRHIQTHYWGDRMSLIVKGYFIEIRITTSTYIEIDYMHKLYDTLNHLPPEILKKSGWFYEKGSYKYILYEKQRS